MSKDGRSRRKGPSLSARVDRERPIGSFASLKVELSVLIIISTAIAFVMAWFLLKMGWSGWIAMPLTLVVALGITYFFSRGLTAPLRQMRDAAEAMADGDYTVRVHATTTSHDEVGLLAQSFNEMAEELQHADQMRRDMVANVRSEERRVGTERRYRETGEESRQQRRKRRRREVQRRRSAGARQAQPPTETPDHG